MCAVAGFVLSNGNPVTEESEVAAEPSLLELQIVEMDDERIEKVRLRKIVKGEELSSETQ
jgi:CBS domain containing-hemolysin-like protein